MTALTCSRVLSALERLSQVSRKHGAQLRLEFGDKDQDITRWDPEPLVPIMVQKDDARVVIQARWGLVSKSSDSIEQGRHYGYNARCETLDERITFRQALVSRRCVVLVESFLEPRDRRLYKISRSDGETLMLAGLWEPPRLTKVPTFTVITCDSNDLLWNINDRMPVVIESEGLDGWLRDGDRTLLTACDSDKLVVEDIGPSSPKRKDPPGQKNLFEE